MGRGKKNKGAKQQVTNSQKISETTKPHKQEMSERNVVQEEGFDFDSDDEKDSGKSSTMVKVDLHGFDSEEDNAAAGGGMTKNPETRERKDLTSNQSTNLHKKRNKAASIHSNTNTQLTPQSHHLVPPSNMTMPVAPSSTSSLENVAPAANYSLGYEHLGNIVVRLLPSEYQPERLPDGRYVMHPAAIGYLAEKLGN